MFKVIGKSAKPWLGGGEVEEKGSIEVQALIQTFQPLSLYDLAGAMNLEMLVAGEYAA